MLDDGTGADDLIGGAENDTDALSNETNSFSDSNGVDRITSTITRSLVFTTVGDPIDPI